jgi:hypothetical protein
MTIGEIANGALRLSSRAAGTTAAVSVVTGYVALGAAILVGRSLLDVASRTRGLVSRVGGGQGDQPPGEPKAA